MFDPTQKTKYKNFAENKKFAKDTQTACPSIDNIVVLWTYKIQQRELGPKMGSKFTFG